MNPRRIECGQTVSTCFGYGIVISNGTNDLVHAVKFPWGIGYLTGLSIQHKIQLTVLSFRAPEDVTRLEEQESDVQQEQSDKIFNWTLTISPSLSITALYDTIAEQLCTHSSSIRISCNGRELPNTHDTVRQSEVKPFSTILCVVDEDLEMLCKRLVLEQGESIFPDAFRKEWETFKAVWIEQVLLAQSPVELANCSYLLESNIQFQSFDPRWRHLRRAWITSNRSSGSWENVVALNLFLMECLKEEYIENEWNADLWEKSIVRCAVADYHGRWALVKYLVIKLESFLRDEVRTSKDWKGLRSAKSWASKVLAEDSFHNPTMASYCYGILDSLIKTDPYQEDYCWIEEDALKTFRESESSCEKLYQVVRYLLQMESMIPKTFFNDKWDITQRNRVVTPLQLITKRKFR